MHQCRACVRDIRRMRRSDGYGAPGTAWVAHSHVEADRQNNNSRGNSTTLDRLRAWTSGACSGAPRARKIALASGGWVPGGPFQLAHARMLRWRPFVGCQPETEADGGAPRAAAARSGGNRRRLKRRMRGKRAKYYYTAGASVRVRVAPGVGYRAASRDDRARSSPARSGKRPRVTDALRRMRSYECNYSRHTFAHELAEKYFRFSFACGCAVASCCLGAPAVQRWPATLRLPSPVSLRRGGSTRANCWRG
jgi:hypothetical protein